MITQKIAITMATGNVQAQGDESSKTPKKRGLVCSTLAAYLSRDFLGGQWSSEERF